MRREMLAVEQWGFFSNKNDDDDDATMAGKVIPGFWSSNKTIHNYGNKKNGDHPAEARCSLHTKNTIY